MEAPSKAVEIKAALAALAAFGTALWGATGWTVIIMLISMGLDYLAGTFAAVRNKEWSSTVAREGLWHKAGELLALLVAILIDIALQVVTQSTAAEAFLNVDLPGSAVTVLVSVWYILTELGSIIENVAALGAPVPAWLTKFLAKLKEKTEPEDKE